MSAVSSASSSATFPFVDASAKSAFERRMWTAIALSLVAHALVLALFRGFLPPMVSIGEGGSAGRPALQALLVGPRTEPKQEESAPPEPAINPALVAPAEAKPVETTLGRSATGSLQGGKTASAGWTASDVNISVGTIPDPAQLGADYVVQLAQRFPNPPQKVPVLLGSPIVDYPQAAMEQGLQGRFAVVVALDGLGKITDAKLVKDDPVFGPALIDALKRMEFTPAQDEGAAVPYWAIVEFVFTIGRPDARTVAPPVAIRRGAIFPRQPSAAR